MTCSHSEKQSFKSQVGIGSKSHDVDADEQIVFEISWFVAGFNDSRIDITSVSSHWLLAMMLWHTSLRIFAHLWITSSTNCYEKPYPGWYSISQEICTRFFRLTSLALWQSNDCPSASKETLMNIDKYFMWIHYERLRNHNKAKHNKTVCIFLRIYCRW